jgi:hypothetical protein
MREPHLQYSRETRKNNEEITLDILEKILQDPDFFHDLMHSGGFGRSMPNRQLLRRNPGWCQVLQHAVVLGRVQGDISEIPDLREVYKNGWLHAELDEEDVLIYIVPTYIHHMCVSIPSVGIIDDFNC